MRLLFLPGSSIPNQGETDGHFVRGKMAGSDGAGEERTGAAVPVESPGQFQRNRIGGEHRQQNIYIRKCSEAMHRRPAGSTRHATG